VLAAKAINSSDVPPTELSDAMDLTLDDRF
jgi:hypothetical protein